MCAQLIPLWPRALPHRNGSETRRGGEWDRKWRRQARSTQGKRKADVTWMAVVAGRSIIVAGVMLAMAVKRRQRSQRHRLTSRRIEMPRSMRPSMSMGVVMRKSSSELKRQGYQPQHRMPSSLPVSHHSHYWML